jgi:1-phosphofructokinase family hexose kinase
MKILCVTPNVAVDRTLVVPGFRDGGVWRAESVHAACGGKGVNVARALIRLGQKPVCAGLLAGGSGAAAAAAEGLEGRWTWIPGETRTCIVIVAGRGRTTVVNEPGTAVERADWQRFAADVGRHASGADGACICGSLPPGCGPGALALLAGSASRGGRVPVWIDTSGEALVEAIAAAPYGIKINADEAATVVGTRIGTVDDAIRAARTLRRRGPARVAITLGAAGAVIATGQGDWSARPPDVTAVNPVASGDCFLAGLIAGMTERVSVGEALRLATACGTANAMHRGVGEFDPARLSWLMAGTEVGLLTGRGGAA